MKNFVQWSMIAAALAGSASAAWATDVGLPLYSQDIGEKSGGIEVYYEHYERDIVRQGASGKVYSGSTKEEDRVIARMKYFVGQRAMFYAEAGMADSVDDNGDNAPLFGMGLHIKAYSSPLFDISTFASATYIPTMEDRSEYPKSPWGHVTMTSDHSIAEFNGGLAVSKLTQLAENMACVPYAGIMAVKIDGDEDYELTLHDEQNRSEERDGYIEEDGAVSGFAGLALLLNDAWAVRAEGRFSNQASWSAGLTYFF